MEGGKGLCVIVLRLLETNLPVKFTVVNYATSAAKARPEPPQTDQLKRGISLSFLGFRWSGLHRVEVWKGLIIPRSGIASSAVRDLPPATIP